MVTSFPFASSSITMNPDVMIVEGAILEVIVVIVRVLVDETVVMLVVLIALVSLVLVTLRELRNWIHEGLPQTTIVAHPGHA